MEWEAARLVVQRRPGWWPWRYEVWSNHAKFDGYEFEWGVTRRFLRAQAALRWVRYQNGEEVT